MCYLYLSHYNYSVLRWPEYFLNSIFFIKILRFFMSWILGRMCLMFPFCVSYRTGSDLVISKKNTQMNNALHTLMHRRSLSIGSADLTWQSQKYCGWPSFMLSHRWSNHFTHDPDNCSCAHHRIEVVDSLSRRMKEKREGKACCPSLSIYFYSHLIRSIRRK